MAAEIGHFALVLALLVALVQSSLPMIGTAVAVVLFAPIWFVGNRAVKESMQGAENPARLDREAKQLIEVITNTSNAVGFHTIGGETQDAIVASLRDLKAGKIKNKNLRPYHAKSSSDTSVWTINTE